MRATLMYGAGDVRVENVPDAQLIEPSDALVRVTRTLAEKGEHIGAESLFHLSLEGMLQATEIPAEDFCTACFSSKYPIPIPAHELAIKHVLERPEASDPAAVKGSASGN